MLKKAKIQNKKENRRGVSEMVAYVILISIALGLAVAVFAWLSWYAKVNPPIDCKEGTSVILEGVACDTTVGAVPLTLTIKNNGLFNVNGVIVNIGSDANKVPVAMPMRQFAGPNEEYGHWGFSPALEPGGTEDVWFSKEIKRGNIEETYSDTYVSIVKIQPFIIQKNKIVCTGAEITEKLDPPCQINP